MTTRDNPQIIDSDQVFADRDAPLRKRLESLVYLIDHRGPELFKEPISEVWTDLLWEIEDEHGEECVPEALDLEGSMALLKIMGHNTFDPKLNLRFENYQWIMSVLKEEGITLSTLIDQNIDNIEVLTGIIHLAGKWYEREEDYIDIIGELSTESRHEVVTSIFNHQDHQDERIRKQVVLSIPKEVWCWPILEGYDEFIPLIERALDDPSPMVRSAALLMLTTPENLYSGRLEDHLLSDHLIEVEHSILLVAQHWKQAPQIPKDLIPPLMRACDFLSWNSNADTDLQIISRVLPLMQDHQRELTEIAIKNLDLLGMSEKSRLVIDQVLHLHRTFPWKEHRHRFIELYDIGYRTIPLGVLFATYGDEVFFDSLLNTRYTFEEVWIEHGQLLKKYNRMKVTIGYLSVKKVINTEHLLLGIWQIYQDDSFPHTPPELYLAFDKYTIGEIQDHSDLSDEEKGSFIEALKRATEYQERKKNSVLSRYKEKLRRRHNSSYP